MWVRKILISPTDKLKRNRKNCGQWAILMTLVVLLEILRKCYTQYSTNYVDNGVVVVHFFVYSDTQN